MKLLPFLVLGLAWSAGAVPAKKAPRPELLPIADVPGLPRVLLLGDSVSVAYTLPVRKALEGRANVHRNLVSIVSSQLGAEQIDEWLGNTAWDVVHFNFGAFDLLLGKDGKVSVPLDRYAANLKLIIAKLHGHSPGAKLIYATSTPVPGEKARAPWLFASGEQAAYAEAARRVATDNGLVINDLLALVEPTLDKIQLPGTIHFRAQGNELIAGQVARVITAALPVGKVVATAVPAVKGDGLRVFTAGHSFHVWVVPLLSEMALHAGIRGHRVAGKSSIGGSTVLKHWDVPDVTNPTKRALVAGEVDVLTLSPIWLPDPGIENFALLAVKHSPDIRITVQEYWLPNDEYNPVYPLDTRKKVDHNAATMPALRAAHARYFADIEAHVRAINANLGKDAMLIVPVGQAVLALRERVIAGTAPGIKDQAELFRDAWGHPTQPIMALAAYCHFAVIYRRSPVGLPRPAILSRNPAWDDQLNRLLQELAWDAVTQHAMTGGVK
jgi:hypothetical protein